MRAYVIARTALRMRAQLVAMAAVTCTALVLRLSRRLCRGRMPLSPLARAASPACPSGKHGEGR
eukprot:16197537-Heterocapsa_arctica.AAC.1